MQLEYETCEHTTGETARQDCVRRKKKSKPEERRCNTIKIYVHLAQDRSDLAETAKHAAQRMSAPRQFVCFFISNVQQGILSGNQKQQYDYEDKHMLATSQSLWTAISLAIQSQERVRLDWWHELTHTVKFGSWEKRSSAQW